MIKPIKAIIYMLQGRIILPDGRDIRIIKRPYPNDKTPCLTLDNSGGTSIIQKNIINEIEDGTPSQVIREERGISVDISIWCDDENDRELITSKVLNLLYLVQADNYYYCSNYLNGVCGFLEDECEAINSNSFRGSKGQCPKPEEYHYQNVFTKFDIIRSTFDVTPPRIQDDMSTNPITLRSIFRISFSYYEFYKINGVHIQTLNTNEELL